MKLTGRYIKADLPAYTKLVAMGYKDKGIKMSHRYWGILSDRTLHGYESVELAEAANLKRCYFEHGLFIEIASTHGAITPESVNNQLKALDCKMCGNYIDEEFSNANCTGCFKNPFYMNCFTPIPKHKYTKKIIYRMDDAPPLIIEHDITEEEYLNETSSL